MKRPYFLAPVFFLGLSTAAVSADDPNAPKAETPNFPYKTLKTKEGLIFRVPSDMPVETRGGIQAPIPFDEYVYGKFEALESKYLRLEKRTALLEQKIERLSPAAGVPADLPASGPAKRDSAAADAAPAAPADESGILKAGVE